MWYHLILSDITYNQDDITLKLDDIILRRGDITLNRGDITSKARWYHILLINSKTAPHRIVSSTDHINHLAASRLRDKLADDTRGIITQLNTTCHFYFLKLDLYDLNNLQIH